jgi:uncharacterized repeat protein (TIGR01451 family)
MKKKLKAKFLAIGGQILVLLVLAAMLITNTGAADDAGSSVCGGGDGSLCGSPNPPSQNYNTSTTTTPGTPVTMSFTALLDGIRWEGPLTFIVDSTTYNKVDQDVSARYLYTATVTYVSGGPPGAAFIHMGFGTGDNSELLPGLSSTITIGEDDNVIVFSFEHGNMAVNASLDGKPWEGSVNYSIEGPYVASGNSVPRSYNSIQTGSYTVNYLSGGPPQATFTGVTPAGRQDIVGGGHTTFTLNFKSPTNPTITVKATLDGNPWVGVVNYNLNGATSLSGTKVEQEFTGVAPGNYSLGQVSGGPENAVLERISPENLDVTSGSQGVFTLVFVSLGNITVSGTLDNAPWPGQCNYTLQGPVTLTGTGLPLTFSNIPLGMYTLTYESGGPANSELSGITPSTIQYVIRSVQTRYTLEFASKGMIMVTGSMYTSSWNGTCRYKITGDTNNGQITLSGTTVPFTFTDLPMGQYTITYLSGAPPDYEYYGIKPGSSLELTPAALNGKFNITFTMGEYIGTTVPPATGADLSIHLTADTLTPNPAGYLTYTITVTNHGPLTATGVSVLFSIVVPDGYFSDNGETAYNPEIGVWTVGTIASGDSVSLIVTISLGTSFENGDEIVQTVEVLTSDQHDPDSTPGNENPLEDDFDSFSVTVTGGP